MTILQNFTKFLATDSKMIGNIYLKKKTREMTTSPNAEDKQNFDLSANIKFEGKKTRQNAENKQTFDLTRKNEKLKLREKLVKTLKINKHLI